MKLDRPDAPHTQPLAPAEWEMDLICEGNQYVAEVKRKLQPMCRLSIAAQGQSESEARTVLADKARAWIAEYLSRDPTGSTEFGSL
ncbi:hypothetical protein [Xenophilus sp. Marseille-Q4582]|uniref:hypothetical protein n=1 Tax=Xenophilus sp. Marseille-Q4582 TaxID=2866600 RepID=UPI001CE4B4B4|nr:hypothetical protein [Xenophilus sp. Marseille-Q4582]